MKNYIKILGDRIFLKYTEAVSWFNTPFEISNGAGLLIYLALILALAHSTILNFTKGCF